MFNKMFPVIMVFTILATSVLLAHSNPMLKDVTREQEDDKLISFVPLTKNRVTEYIGTTPFYTSTFSLGAYDPGNELVQCYQENTSYLEPENAAFIFRYPSGGGLAKNVTLIAISVEHSSPSCEVFVINGGIGYNWISILIRSMNTLRFSYRVSTFGI